MEAWLNKHYKSLSVTYHCISHLLWADDLIVLALQKQLYTLNNFRVEWGVEINADKNKLIKINVRFDNYQPDPLKK